MPDAPERLRELLTDTYRIEREIARGGMATVYLAHDVRHDRQVALKVMDPEIAQAVGPERFLREIKLAAKLSHPNILTVHASGESGGYLWYVMPYVDGQTLRHRLEKDSRVPLPDVLRLMREAAEALGYAHSMGIVHRDIKPENILISRGHAMIADFGIAHAMDTARDDRLTASGIAIGTTAYMSPQQALGEPIDATTDVWALGCVMYEMLAGKPPFGTGGREAITRALLGKRDPLPKDSNAVPANVEAIVNKALANDKADRYPSGTQMAEAIESLPASGEVVVASHEAEPPLPRIRYTQIVAIVALIVIALTAGIWWSARPSSPPVSASTAASLSGDSIARTLYQRAKDQEARRTPTGWSQAIQLFSQSIARDSSFALAWAGLARVANFAYTRGSDIALSRDSLLHLALTASDKAVALAPNDAAVWLVKARTAIMMDPTDEAPRLFGVRKAISLDSTYALAWFELGITNEDMLQPGEALAAFQRAAQLDPSNVQTLSFIGLHYLWNGDYEKGIKWADSAVNLDPTYPLARDVAGQLTYEMGRFAESATRYEVESRLTTGREQANAIAMLARTLVAQGNLSEAHRYMDRAIKAIDPAHPAKHEAAVFAAAFAAFHDTLGAVRIMSAYQPRGDIHYQLHLKRDPGLRWIKGSRWERELLVPDPIVR
jgi:serine/threonine protein kinase/Flp pilus assembly protein TadD